MAPKIGLKNEWFSPFLPNQEAQPQLFSTLVRTSPNPFKTQAWSLTSNLCYSQNCPFSFFGVSMTPQNQPYPKLQIELSNQLHCMSGIHLSWYEVHGHNMKQIWDISPVTLRGSMWNSVLNFSSVQRFSCKHHIDNHYFYKEL